MAKKSKKSKKPVLAEKPLMDLRTDDVAAAFSPVRGERAFRPERALQLGYVDFGEDHTGPEVGTSYPVVSASSQSVGRVPFPKADYRRLQLDLSDLFVDGLPGFSSKRNKGLLKVQASTKNPHDLSGSMTDAAFVTEFSAKDSSYAPAFPCRGAIRNILFQDWVTLSFELYELDSKASKHLGKVKRVLEEIPDIKSLDVLKGFPYLNLTTQLFQGIINTFGKDADDPPWGELPILALEPTPGGAFLRTGIYFLAEKQTSKGKPVELDSLEYKDGQIRSKLEKRLPNHLLFGVSVVTHEGEGPER